MNPPECLKDIMEEEVTVPTLQMTDLHSNFFKESHHIVFGRLSLSSIEHDLFALFLLRLHKDHWEDFLSGKNIRCPEYTFNSNVLSEWFNLKKNDLCTILKRPCSRLISQKLGIEDDKNHRFLYMPLFKRVEFRYGILTLVPNDQLLKEYLCVSEGHSQIPHVIFRKLKRESSKRIYGLLCRFQKKGRLHALPMKTLQSILGLLDEKDEIKKKTYKQTSNIIRFLIKPAIDEICQFEPRIKFYKEGDKKAHYFGFSVVKDGARIIGIDFKFDWLAHEEYDEISVNLSGFEKAHAIVNILLEHESMIVHLMDNKKELLIYLKSIQIKKKDLSHVMSNFSILESSGFLPDNFWFYCARLLTLL